MIFADRPSSEEVLELLVRDVMYLTELRDLLVERILNQVHRASELCLHELKNAEDEEWEEKVQNLELVPYSFTQLISRPRRYLNDDLDKDGFCVKVRSSPQSAGFVVSHNSVAHAGHEYGRRCRPLPDHLRLRRRPFLSRPHSRSGIVKYPGRRKWMMEESEDNVQSTLTTQRGSSLAYEDVRVGSSCIDGTSLEAIVKSRDLLEDDDDVPPFSDPFLSSASHSIPPSSSPCRRSSMKGDLIEDPFGLSMDPPTDASSVKTSSSTRSSFVGRSTLGRGSVLSMFKSAEPANPSIHIGDTDGRILEHRSSSRSRIHDDFADEFCEIPPGRRTSGITDPDKKFFV